MKTYIKCWHGSSKEVRTVEKAGYNLGITEETDPFKVAKNIQEYGDVFVAISPKRHSQEYGYFHTVTVSDNLFRQR